MLKLTATNKSAHPEHKCALRYHYLVRLPPVILCVTFGELLPLLGQIVEGEDSGNRAYRNTRTTVNALDRINIKHLLGSVRLLIFLRMNAIDRAGVYAGGVLGP